MKSNTRSLDFGGECPPDENFVRVYFLQKEPHWTRPLDFTDIIMENGVNNNGKLLKELETACMDMDLAWTSYA